MKTSNKILIGTLVVVVLLFTAIHFALKRKYNKGEYTVQQSESKKDSITIKPVRFVKLSGLDNVVLVPSYSYRIEVEKNMPSYFKYFVSGDTLVIRGDTTNSSDPNGNKDQRRVYQEISLHLPQMAMIEAENSSLSVTGKMDSAETGIMKFDLTRARLFFTNHYNNNDTAQYFGNVSITAKGRSEVEFSANTVHFNQLNIDLQKSTFRDNEMGDIRQFSLGADDSSLVQVGGANFQKLNIVPKQTQQ
jgi:hypothetical protein